MDEERLNQEFGANLRNLRLDAELTQKELANAADISRTSVVNIEQGRQGVSLHTLYRLAEALAVDQSDLLPHVQEPRPLEIAHGDKSDQGQKVVQTILRRARSEEATS